MTILESVYGSDINTQDNHEIDEFPGISRELGREVQRIKAHSYRQEQLRRIKEGRATQEAEAVIQEELIEQIEPQREEIIQDTDNDETEEVIEYKTSPFPIFPFILLISAFIGIMCDNSATPEAKQPQFEGTGVRSGQAYIVDNYSPIPKKIPIDTVCATTGLGISYIDTNDDGIASSGERYDTSPVAGYEQYYRDFIVTIDGLDYEVVCEP